MIPILIGQNLLPYVSGNKHLWDWCRGPNQVSSCSTRSPQPSCESSALFKAQTAQPCIGGQKVSHPEWASGNWAGMATCINTLAKVQDRPGRCKTCYGKGCMECKLTVSVFCLKKIRMIFFKKEKNILQGVFDFSLEKRNVALNCEKRNRLEYISKRLIFRKKKLLKYREGFGWRKE